MSLQREVLQVYNSRVYLARYVPLSGFLNLLAVYTLNCPEALFHAPGTHGVHPAGFSPRKQHRPLIRFDYLAYPVLILYLNPPAWKQADS
jgi:hypothetical protein